MNKNADQVIVWSREKRQTQEQPFVQVPEVDKLAAQARRLPEKQDRQASAEVKNPRNSPIITNFANKH